MKIFCGVAAYSLPKLKLFAPTVGLEFSVCGLACLGTISTRPFDAPGCIFCKEQMLCYKIEKRTSMSYLIFTLGFDLLHDEIEHMACDEAYEYCTQVAIEFVHSKYYDYNCSEYDALQDFLKETGYIN